MVNERMQPKNFVTSMRNVNWPNILTIVRVAMIPFMVLVYYMPFKWSGLVACIVFTIACVTDWFDGYLARKLDQSTPFGAFLDPVADKLIVATALVLLCETYATPWLTIPAIIILSREIVISALREWMAEIGKRASVAVNVLGKMKTFMQMMAIGGLLGFERGGVIATLAHILLYGSAVLTLWSMTQYLKAAMPLLGSPLAVNSKISR